MQAITAPSSDLSRSTFLLLAALLAGAPLGCAQLLGIEELDDQSDANIFDGQVAGDAQATGDANGAVDAGGSECFAGQTGRPISNLADRGVLVRYYIGQADQAAGQLCDYAPHLSPPVHLLLVDQPEFSPPDAQGNVGLTWDAPGEKGSAMVSDIAGTKLLELAGSKTATIEIVADVDNFAQDGSRLLQIADPGNNAPNNERLALKLLESDRIEFRWRYNNLAAYWNFTWRNSGRSVIHLVLNTEAALVPVRLYFNGVEVTDATGIQEPGTNMQTILMASGFRFAVGNRTDGDRSIEGTIFYAALYKSALTPDEVMMNATRLLESDEAPQ